MNKAVREDLTCDRNLAEASAPGLAGIGPGALPRAAVFASFRDRALEAVGRANQCHTTLPLYLKTAADLVCRAGAARWMREYASRRFLKLGMQEGRAPTVLCIS